MDLERIKLRCIECGECWLWAGVFSDSGMPRLGGKYVRRLTWDRPVPKGSVLTPSCGAKRCVNPEHLKVITRAQVAAKVARSPIAKLKMAASIARKKRLNSKLTMEQALQIRASERPHSQIAKEFGVSKARVGVIRRGQAWREFGANPFQALMR